MTLAMDDGVGEIIAKLRELNLDTNTLVLFFSDNGGTSENRSTGPKLRGQKGTVWEGGHRVPSIAWWPGKIAAGSTTDQLAMTVDVFPTLVELAGAKLPDNHQLDGVSLASVLTAGQSLAPRQRFWGHVNGAGKKTYAMRDGVWKLVVETKGTPHLFRLDSDLKEANNLADQQPERLRDMLAALSAWKQDVDKPKVR